MSTDQTLAGDTGPASTPFGTPTPVPLTPETPLDLDELLSKARLVERTAKICIRGDLYGDWQEAIEELAGMVDADGVPLEGPDGSLADETQAVEQGEKVTRLREEMKQWMRTVRFRALPDDAWRPFVREHEGPDGRPKDQDAWNEAIIARTAIAPTLTVEQVRQLRSKIGTPQFTHLADAAFYACTLGGLDVPKSPDFLPTRTRRASERS